MNDGRIDLLPPVFGARARLRLLNRRIAFCGVVAVAILILLAFHARIVRSSAEARLTEARDRADQVLSAEQLEKSLLEQLQSTSDRIEAWRSVALPIPVGGVLVTMANTLPEGVVLEQLMVDVTGVRVDSRGQRAGDRRLIGRLQGFAPDESTVRDFVHQLRERNPFEEVRRGFTALVEQGDEVKTRFSVDFEVDLETPWKAVEIESEHAIVVEGHS
jgi:Tfp pilus assembly protein PilN